MLHLTGLEHIDTRFNAHAKPSKLDAKRAALVKLALSLALDAGSVGITVSDIRMEAFRKNLIPGDARGRQLSYLGSIPLLAGLVKTGRYIRSEIAVTHGNLQMVWLHPDLDAGDTPYRQ